MELGCACELDARRDDTGCHIGAVVVVRPEPVRGGFLVLLDALEQPLREPVVPHNASDGARGRVRRRVAPAAAFSRRRDR